MIDTLIYCNDLEALKVQLKTDSRYDAESDTYNSGCTLTPIKHSENNTSLSYTRGFSLDLSVYTMLEDLGDYDVMFTTPESEAKYRSVYPYLTPIEYVDEEGVTQSYMRPQKIGAFA